MSANATPSSKISVPKGVIKQIRKRLNQDLIDRWFPACVTPRGFHEEFGHDWKPIEFHSRFLVCQARLTWVAATMAEFDPVKREIYSAYAMHGLRYLADKMFNPDDGSFRWALDEQDHPTGPHAQERHAYGMSFAIYALAAVARSLGSTEALDLAKRTFQYLEKHHFDKENGTYFEATDPKGNPLLTGPFEGNSPSDGIGTPYGQKSQNTHLHLLEAFTELFDIWPDPVLKSRLEGLLTCFQTTLYSEPGWLHGFIERDGKPVPGTVSYGHDVEAAHLMLDAARAIGRPNHPGVLVKAVALLDYALEHGWDKKGGGFLYAGEPDGRVTDHSKNWWVQAEGMLALARLGAFTGNPKYATAFLDQWRWIDRFQIDDVRGGWHESLTLDGTPSPSVESPLPKGHPRKGHPWKEAYHEGRALMFSLMWIENPDEPVAEASDLNF